MESHRRRHRMMESTRRSQGGITVIGFLILAVLVGVVGLAVLKVTPMYLKKMRMDAILTDIARELQGESPTPGSIRNAIARRFAVEDINMDIDALKITQNSGGYTLTVNFEERAPYVADVYLVVVYNNTVEIRR
jgi:hypothetical protein